MQPTELKNDYLIRRVAVDFQIPLLPDIKVAKQFVDGLSWMRSKELEIKSWEEYRTWGEPLPGYWRALARILASPCQNTGVP